MCVRSMGTHFFHAAYTNTDSWNNGCWSGVVHRFLTRGALRLPADLAMGRRGTSAGTYAVRGTLILVQVLTFLLSLPDLES